MATLDSNSSPGFAVRELMVEDRITGSWVPAGTTMGFGGSGGGAGVCTAADGAAPCCALSAGELVEVSPLLHPAAIANPAISANAAHFLFMKFPHFGVRSCIVLLRCLFFRDFG